MQYYVMYWESTGYTRGLSPTFFREYGPYDRDDYIKGFCDKDEDDNEDIVELNAGAATNRKAVLKVMFPSNLIPSTGYAAVVPIDELKPLWDRFEKAKSEAKAAFDEIHSKEVDSWTYGFIPLRNLVSRNNSGKRLPHLIATFSATRDLLLLVDHYSVGWRKKVSEVHLTERLTAWDLPECTWKEPNMAFLELVLRRPL